MAVRKRRRRPFGSGRFAESCVPGLQKTRGTWEGKRKSKRTSPALVTTRRTWTRGASSAYLSVLQPLKFGFHCFAAGTFIDFRRRTVMDAAFIVIVERTPLSLSFCPPSPLSSSVPLLQEIPSVHRVEIRFPSRNLRDFRSRERLEGLRVSFGHQPYVNKLGGRNFNFSHVRREF